MNKILVFVTLLLAGTAYYFWSANKTPIIVTQEIPSIVPITEPENSIIRYSVPEQAALATDQPPEPATLEQPLPLLNESDGSIEEAFGKILDTSRLSVFRITEFVFFKDFIRRFVVTIDNMTRKGLPQRFIFVQRPAGTFSAPQAETKDKFLLDKENFLRYDRFIQISQAINSQQLVNIYVRYYPLFQEAYQELGYPDRYFNDRLIDVIDHLLETPDAQEPIKLVRPKVLFQFANPDLEALSAGQKILIRMGPDHAVKMKRKLRELRQILTTLK